jgi:hypothetical protein
MTTEGLMVTASTSILPDCFACFALVDDRTLSDEKIVEY